VRPEPWHLSHAAVAARAARSLDPAALRGVLAAADIDGRDEILEGLDRHFADYVVNVDRPPEAALNSPRLA
jgi:hypothetical protein